MLRLVDYGVVDCAKAKTQFMIVYAYHMYEGSIRLEVNKNKTSTKRSSRKRNLIVSTMSIAK